MDWLNKLGSLKKKQQDLINEFELVVGEIENDQIIQEQDHWRKLAEAHGREVEQLRGDLIRLTSEKERLQIALRDQLLEEKINLIKTSREKLVTYFKTTTDQCQDRLTEVESVAKQQLGQLKNSVLNDLAHNQESFSQQITRLESDLAENLRRQEAELIQAKDKIIGDAAQKLDALADEELTSEMVQKRIKQNQWELKLGLNLLNKIGILLIFLGMSAAFKYSFDNWMSSYLKGISFFVLGMVLLTGGDLFYRKKKEGFATGLIGGGFAVLYGSVFYCYFLLKIIPLDIGLLLAILITGVALTFSIRYNSQTIGCFALIGGFLPFLSYVTSFGLQGNMIPAVMGYLLILNLLLLTISYWKSWSLIKYVSFALNIPSLIYLVFNISMLNVAIGYAVITFLMYLGITLIYPVAQRKILGNGDTVLLGLNTLVNCLIIFLLFSKAGWNDYRGIMALGFGVIYTGLGWLVRQKIPGGNRSAILFFGTALTFAFLTVPFQFGIKWLTLGWLIEAIILVILGSQCKQKNVELIGWIIFVGCAVLFYQIEMSCYLLQVPVPFFKFKYLGLTMGEVIVLIHYLVLQENGMFLRKSSTGNLVSFYKYLVVVCVWLYLVITGNDYLHQFLPSAVNHYFYQGFWTALVSFGLSTVLQRLPLLRGNLVRGVAGCLSSIAIIICLWLNFSSSVYQTSGSEYIAGRYVTLALLIGINLIVFFNLRYLARNLVESQRLHVEHYPLILGLYLAINLSGFLSVQFGLEISNLIFSIVYLVVAVSFIVYGFVRRYFYIRRAGLAIIFLAVAKLFLVDLSFLGALGKIIAYFSFGLTLLAISFIYQRISDTLEGTRVGKASIE